MLRFTRSAALMTVSHFSLLRFDDHNKPLEWGAIKAVMGKFRVQFNLLVGNPGF